MNLIVVLITVSLCTMNIDGMPPIRPRSSSTALDITHFMDSLRRFVGEVAGLLLLLPPSLQSTSAFSASGPRAPDWFHHDRNDALIMQGMAYLDTIKIINTCVHDMNVADDELLNINIDHVDTDLFINILNELAVLVQLLQELDIVIGGNNLPHHHERNIDSEHEEHIGLGLRNNQSLYITVQPIGRPRIHISMEQLEILSDLGFSWVEVAIVWCQCQNNKEQKT